MSAPGPENTYVGIPVWLTKQVVAACKRVTGGMSIAEYVEVAVKEKLEREAAGGD